jgi:hypothetical protein
MKMTLRELIVALRVAMATRARVPKIAALIVGKIAKAVRVMGTKNIVVMMTMVRMRVMMEMAMMIMMAVTMRVATTVTVAAEVSAVMQCVLKLRLKRMKRVRLFQPWFSVGGL